MPETYCLPVSFKTDRFFLRRVVMDDAEAIFDGYASDDSVTRFLGWKSHENSMQTAAFLESVGTEWNQGTGFPLVAFDLQCPDKLIGMFHPRLLGRRVRYGYVLRASAWGNGCASEVMRWLVDHALTHPAIFRAEAFCDVDNAASARVMEKAGMTYEGILRRYFTHPNISNDPRDCLLYAKVR
jgi:[ribosomal protein S5]-alanine N-acetyltransferase